MVTYRCGSGRERAPDEPSASDVRACENVRLRVNHTICMPAKIGPKRDRALARAGCYFDGGAATCGANVFSICGERGICVRAIMIVRRVANAQMPRALSRTSFRALQYCDEAQSIAAATDWTATQCAQLRRTSVARTIAAEFPRSCPTRIGLGRSAYLRLQRLPYRACAREH